MPESQLHGMVCIIYQWQLLLYIWKLNTLGSGWFKSVGRKCLIFFKISLKCVEVSLGLQVLFTFICISLGTVPWDLLAASFFNIMERLRSRGMPKKKKKKKKKKTSSEGYQSVVDLETKSDSSKPQKISIKQYLASLPPGIMRHPHLARVSS